MSNLATIVNNILADSGIDDLNVVVTNGSYSNPSWITALAWSKITGTPTTLAGYGITNGVPTSRTLTINGVSYDLSADRTWTIASGVTSVNAGTGVSVNSTTGAVTVSIGQSVATNASPTFDQVITNNNGNGTNFRIGDDVWIGDINAANTFRVQGLQDATQGYIVFGNSNATALGRSGTGALTYGGNTVLHAGNYNSYAPTLTGGGASGTWGINITGNADTVDGYHLDQTLTTGASPTWTTGNFRGDINVGMWGNSSNVNMYDGDEGTRVLHCNSNRIGFLTQGGSWGAYCDDAGNWAAANFSGSSSGTNTGDQTNISGNAATATQTIATVTGTNSIELVRGNMADNDQFRILVGGTGSNSGFAEIATADDGTEPIYVRQYTGVFSSLVRTATLLDGSGNTSFPGTVTAPTFSGSLSGNASSASTSSQVTVNSGNASAAWYPIVWHSGNNVYSSSGTAQIYPAGGYGQFNYVNTSDNIETSITGFIIKNGDNYHRTASPTTAANSIRGVASGTWSINVTGSAGSASSASSATTATRLDGTANGATFYTNNASYGAWRSGGSRNGWYGIEFENQMNLMMNTNESGHHNNSYGWQFRWADGTLYCHKNSYGGGTSATVLDSSNAPYAWNMNQYVRTSDSPTFQQVYADGWFRNNTYNTGLYSQNTTQHWSSKDNGYWDASSTNSVSSIRLWTGGHISALRGYLFANTSNEIGFLDAQGDWTMRTTDAQNCFCHGTLYSYNDVIAYYSDERLKTKTGKIENALEKVCSLEAFTYTHNDLAVSLGYDNNKESQIGLSAQEVQKIAPELVALAGFDVATDEEGNKYSKSGENYLTIKYDRLVPLLIEAIKEQQKQIDELKAKLS